jgi:hypothetical protein
MKRTAVLVLTLALTVLSSSAAALDFPFIDLRIGARGGPNLNFISDVQEDDPVPVYPGFFGIGWFVGGALSFDYVGPLVGVGMTIELLYSSESASGSVEFDRDLGDDGTKEESELGLSSSGLHLPIYARAMIGAGVARFFVNLGVDLNFQRSDTEMTVEQLGDVAPFTEGCSPGIDCDPFPARDFGVSPVESTTYFLLGMGLDIDVGPVTVPVEFRWLVNPNYPLSVRERTVETGGVPEYLYEDAWHYQVFVLFGANYKIF